MITVVIGQRGTGKTHFLKRVQEYLKPQVICIDLDEYIEKKEKIKIADIFKKKGENYFRNLEEQYFRELLQIAILKKQNYYLSVGGGFDVNLVPKFVRILWLRRSSEKWGRIFTDRPRLNPELNPIEEFFERARPRAVKFVATAWEEYLMPEGLRKLNRTEKHFVCDSIADIHLGLTLLPENFKHPTQFHYFIKKRLLWGLKFFEVRDDLINKAQFYRLLPALSQAPILFALRNGKVTSKELGKIRSQVRWVDCDQLLLTKYQNSNHQIDIVSRHHRSASDNLPSIFEELDIIEKQGYHIKLAVIIDNFDELKAGHQWFMKNPERRSFLPRSQDGRWQWYRQLMTGKMFIEFFREGLGSALDQPTLYQVVQQKFLSSAQNFAAILGDPVDHSFTPIEQEDFFAQRNMPVYAIAVSETEFDSAIKILSELGLKAAAVTSPLKKQAYSWVRIKDESADEFHSINTLAWDASKKHWCGVNTDLPGLTVLLKDMLKTDQQKIAVWGGGGTLPLLKKLLPNAKYFSAQTGQIREANEGAKNFYPNYIIWAAPRADGKTVVYPPKNWKPKSVIDLNYREDSGGRDYALLSCSKYISGESMFYEQAIHQRKFWKNYL